MKYGPKLWRIRTCFFSVLCIASAVVSLAEDRHAGARAPGEVVRAYLRAVYARDFAAAYRLISSTDRRTRDMDRYVRQRGAFNGFVLEAARQVSESVRTEIVEQRVVDNDHIQLRIRYQVPDSAALAPVLLNWDPYRLNALTADDRVQLLRTLQRRQQERSLRMTGGEETFDLVREDGEWRIFLDWAAGVRIPLRLEPLAGEGLQATLSKSEMKLQPGDTFEIALTLKNSTAQPIVARIGHLVEPRIAADYLDFIQCGFLLPVTIEPGNEQEYSGTYLVRGTLPEGIKVIQLTYDFKILE